jgi:hypothetical protein
MKDDFPRPSHRMQCRSCNSSTLHTDVYKVYFSRRNVDRLCDAVASMGYPRPRPDGDGLYRNMYRIYQLYPGYQGVDVQLYSQPGVVERWVEFMDQQFLELYKGDMYAKQRLYDAYDRDRSSPLRPIPYPEVTSGDRGCIGVYTGNRLR